MMRYQHTQAGPLHYLLFGVAAFFLVLAWLAIEQPVVAGVLLIAACATCLFAFCFRSLTVADEGEKLSIKFGPLPLFRTSVPYEKITSVESGRSSLIDGLGIHYVPFRGWTYNLWGFGCAVVHLGKKTIRIGSDDVENLVELLQSRISCRAS